MRNTLLTKYNSEPLKWDSLKKIDYIAITQKMFNVVERFYDSKIQIDTDIHVEGFPADSHFSLEEFKKHFSNQTSYRRLNISIIVPEKVFSCAFTTGPHDEQWVYADSRDHTSAQLEDILQELIDFVLPLFQSRAQHDLTDNIINNPTPNKNQCKSTSNSVDKSKKNKFSIPWDAVAGICAAVGTIIAIVSFFLSK